MKRLQAASLELSLSLPVIRILHFPLPTQMIDYASSIYIQKIISLGAQVIMDFYMSYAKRYESFCSSRGRCPCASDQRKQISPHRQSLDRVCFPPSVTILCCSPSPHLLSSWIPLAPLILASRRTSQTPPLVDLSTMPAIRTKSEKDTDKITIYDVNRDFQYPDSDFALISSVGVIFKIHTHHMAQPGPGSDPLSGRVRPI